MTDSNDRERRLIKMTQIKLTPYMTHTPTPKQQAFLWLDCLEALYGGAAGGGKSDALLMAALQYVDVPGYAAILFRRTFPELRKADSLIPRADEWLRGTDAKWNDNDKKWTFPSGATLSFGYMKTEEDQHLYQSAAFQFIGFDELTSFSREQYTYMLSRLRKPSGLTDDNPLAKVPLRIRGATNPGGRGHLWVKKRFITRRDNAPENHTERVFIPAKLQENPHIDQASYERGLLELDDETREQLMEGSWEAREPGEFVIPDRSWIEAAVRLGEEIWVGGVPRPGEPKGAAEGEPYAFGIDWGERTASYIIWPLPEGGIFVPPSEVLGLHEDTATVTKRMLEKAENLGLPVTRAYYDAAGVQNMRTFVATVRKEDGWGRLRTVSIPFNKYKRETINYERILFKRTAEGKTSRIIAIHPANEELIRQLEVWKFKKVADRPTDDIEKEDDHGPDALVSGIAPTAAKHRSYIEALIQKAKEKKDGSAD